VATSGNGTIRSQSRVATSGNGTIRRQNQCVQIRIHKVK
jgi:hypothetical protein